MDEVTLRIHALISSYLVKLATDRTGWEVLYRDPEDGRLWELSYPQGNLNGGGSPMLKVISIQDAQIRYGLNMG